MLEIIKRASSVTHYYDELINNIPTYSLADYQYAAKILPVGLVLAAISLFGLKETYCHRTQG